MLRKGRRDAGGLGAGDEVPGVSVAGLVKTFGSKRAVDGIGLEAEPGTFLVLLGPSGSGKSTLLRCLAGIEEPSAGTIRFGRRTVDGPGVHLPPERRNLAMVFQDYALWPHLTAEQNVAFALQRRRVDPEARGRAAREMLEQVGLAGLAGRYPGELSGGEQQRVALARALVAEPGLLLFDEPLSNLDADRRERLRVDIGAMVRRSGATAVYITHDQAEAFALADRVGVLDAGRLVQYDSPERVYEQPATTFVARFTGLAGELVGTHVGGGVDGIGVDCPVGVVRGRPLVTAELQRGQRVRVLVRPSAARLAEGDQRGSGSPLVEGVICDAAFRGWGYEHVVELPGGAQLSGVPASRRVPFGERVSVTLDPRGCLVAADDGPPAGAAGPGARRADGVAGSRQMSVPVEVAGEDPSATARGLGERVGSQPESPPLSGLRH